MFIDGRSLNNEELQADICIIGGGAAGIAIVHSLLNSGLQVIIIESGGFGPQADTLALNSGKISGLPYSLNASRLRWFGGSSNHWEGMCAPLSEFDFSKRAWIENSGWPIKRSDLDDYYIKAAKFLNIGGDASYDFSTPQNMLENPDSLSFASWRFAKNLSLGEVYNQEIKDSDNIRAIINSNVTDIKLTEDGTAVSGLEVATLAGQKFNVIAKKYVLACGGIENARILLSCNRQVEKGIGNHNDLVGRYFMEHPHNDVGMIHSFSSPEKIKAFRLYFKKNRGLKPVNDKIVKGSESQIMNITMSNAAMEKHGVGGGSLVISTVQQSQNNDPEFLHISNVFGAKNESQELGLYARTEQVPNFESRVMLSNDRRDALGIPVVDLRWVMGRQDWQTISTLVTLFAESISAAGIGVVQLTKWLREFDGWPRNLGWGGHHMGTTRMHGDASLGVVDKDCKVHGIGNLYIAGSSVFPTSGWANPTYTIIALAFRLAEKLKIPA